MDFVEAQTGRRGFVMTGEARELERYQSAIDRIDGDLAALQELTADNPYQQQQLLVLRPLLARRLAMWRESVELRKAEGFESERQRQLMQEGQDLNESIRRTIRAMEGEENALLEQRQREVRASAQYAMQLVVRGTLVGVALLMIVFALLKREIGQRTRMEQTLRLRTAELEMANKELEAFSYSVSHDLRNPLGVVDGYSDVLLTAYADKLDQTGQGLFTAGARRDRPDGTTHRRPASVLPRPPCRVASRRDGSERAGRDGGCRTAASGS